MADSRQHHLSQQMEAFIHGLPKAELHIHIEGALEPELMFEIAAKNGCSLPFESVADIRRAYNFKRSAVLSGSLLSRCASAAGGG